MLFHLNNSTFSTWRTNGCPVCWKMANASFSLLVKSSFFFLFFFVVYIMTYLCIICTRNNTGVPPSAKTPGNTGLFVADDLTFFSTRTENFFVTNVSGGCWPILHSGSQIPVSLRLYIMNTFMQGCVSTEVIVLWYIGRSCVAICRYYRDVPIPPKSAVSKTVNCCAQAVSGECSKQDTQMQ